MTDVLAAVVTTEFAVRCYREAVIRQTLRRQLPVILAMSLCAAAQTAADPEAVGRSFVEAVRSGSVERRLALLHPGTRSCITDETNDYFAWIVLRQMKYVIPEKFTVRAQTLVEAPQPEASSYPVRPTHSVQVDFETRPNSSTTVVLMAAKDGGRWYEVLPCPLPEMVAQMKKAAADRAALEDRAQKAVAALDAGARSELLTLLQRGHRVEAIQKAAGTGQDLAVARRIVDLIESRAGLLPLPMFVSDSKTAVPAGRSASGRPSMDIVIREVERRPRASVLSIDTKSVGSSVGSSFFILCGVRRLAELRGGYRYAAKIETFGKQTRMLVGFLESREEKLDALGPDFRVLQSPKDVIDLEEFAPICDLIR